MKKMKLLVGMVAVAVVLGALNLSPAAAQALDGVWFQLKVKTKGRSMDQITGENAKLNLSFTSYIQLHWDGTKKRYNLDLWNDTDTGWQKSPATLHLVPYPQVAGRDNVFFLIALAIKSPEWSITIDHDPLVVHKTDSRGALHATWQGAGSAEGRSQITPTEFYFGSCSVKGKNVASGNLPFSP